MDIDVLRFIFIGVFKLLCYILCVLKSTHSHTCVLPKGFEPLSFQLKYNPPIFEYKIHSVEVDLVGPKAYHSSFDDDQLM